jgi:PAS domain S-box-containing protein
VDRPLGRDDWSSTEIADLRQRVAQLEVVCSEQKLAASALQLHNQWLAVANRLLEVGLTEDDPALILATACRELASALGMSRAVAYWRDDLVPTPRAVARFSQPARKTSRTAVSSDRDEPIYEDWASLRRPLAIVVNHETARRRKVHELMRQRGVATLLILPIVSHDVSACLELSHTEHRSFSREEIAQFEQMCGQMARVLSRMKLARLLHPLNVAVDSASEAIIVCDLNGSIIYVNPAFEQMSGFSRGEVVGQTPRLMKSGEHDAAFYRHLWSTITRGETWRGRIVNRRRDGSCYSVDSTIRPVRDEAGRAVGYVAAQRDITRELQLEEQYRQAQKMEMLGQLTAGIAHDFNNVLTAVNGYAELLRNQLPAASPPHDLVVKLLRAGQRGADLVRQLLLFSRKQANTPQVVNLNHVVGELEPMLRRIIGEHIQLVTHLAPDLWAVRADPSQIEQIIVNLVVNARDAMPNGGSVCIETGNVVLDDTTVSGHLSGRPGEHVLLAVSDTGTGMSTEVKAHLFEPFFTTKGRGKGTGLGLATVYGIVEQYNGSIWVYSEEGIGTTFKICLPRVSQTPTGIPRPDQVELARGGRETILVVEDDPSVRDLTGMMLQDHGYTVLAAEGGQEALRLARECDVGIDLLLSDVVLPDTGAGALTEQLRLIHPRMKVLYMSGYGHDVAARRGVTLGRLTFLQKPFNSLELARKVREVLDRPTTYSRLSDPAAGPAGGRSLFGSPERMRHWHLW